MAQAISRKHSKIFLINALIFLCFCTSESVITKRQNAVSLTEKPEWLISLEAKVPKAPLCGQNVQNRVLGGTKTALNEFPWSVLIGHESRSPDGEISFNCGGSLINKLYVLTGEISLKILSFFKLHLFHSRSLCQQVFKKRSDWRMEFGN